MTTTESNPEGGGVAAGRPAEPPPHHALPWFVIFSALCGFLIMAAGLFAPSIHSRLAEVQWPMIAVGMAIVMGAVGAQVTTKLKWVSASGAAAMVLVFARIFEPFADSPFVYGHLRGTESSQGVVVKAQSRFLSGKTDDSGHWQFFARSEWLNGQIFSITVDRGQDTSPRQIIIGCIDIGLLHNAVGAQSGLDLTLTPNGSDGEWVLVETSRSAALGFFGNPECPVARQPEGGGTPPPQAADASGADLLGLLVRSAAAQDAIADPDKVYGALSSLSLDEQIQARDYVTGLRDLAQIEALVENWNPADSTQAADTNLLVAWVSAIRQDRDVAVSLASSLNQQQLNYLAELAGSPDRTIRFNATELMSWLVQSTGWSEAVEQDQAEMIVQAVLRPFEDPQGFGTMVTDMSTIDVGNASYNAMVALNWAGCDIADAYREEIADTLASFESQAFVREGDFSRTLELSEEFRTMDCR